MNGMFRVDQPWWLLLLLTIPVLVWQSRHSLAGLGRFRQVLATSLRGLIVLLLILALAGLQWVQRFDRLAVLFVLDQSQSIPNAATQEALELITRKVSQRQQMQDLAGVVVFGRQAKLEVPPAQYPDTFTCYRIESLFDRQYSDLAAGVKLALGSFPPDVAKRIVLISDGNPNQGDVLQQALAAAENKIPIDVVPIEYQYDSEILVEKIDVPSDLKKGDTANLKVVLRSTKPSSGLLRLNRRSELGVETLAEEKVTLKAGLNTFILKQTIHEPDFYTYEAQFEPDALGADRISNNNYATGYMNILGEGKILLIHCDPVDTNLLAEQLRLNGLKVVARQPEEVSENLADLRTYDAVIVANVPADRLGETKQRTLAANTRELGAGLIMIGGPDSFGAGGYRDTPIEEALPVEMEIKANKVRGKGALVLIMHACEMPEGNFWEKVVAKLAVQKLGSADECGLLEWNGVTSWLFPLQEVGPARKTMLSRIDKMFPGDMPDFAPSMQSALNALQNSNASVKHVVIISDGDPTPPPSQLLTAFKTAKITISTVGIATHGQANSAVLKNIAAATGGNYHQVTNSRNLPQIYTEEVRVVARPLIFERSNPWQLQVKYFSEPIGGLPVNLPPIQGFILTTPKQSAEVPILSPLPVENEQNSILAHWVYGLGKAVAFTSDAGRKWTNDWLQTELYGKFWSQVVRWAMRPAETQKLMLSVQEQDGQVRIVANAIGDGNEFLNFLDVDLNVVRPDKSNLSLPLRQTGPGRYEGTFTADQAGTFFIRVGYKDEQGKAGLGFVTTGLSISYPPEYRDLESDRNLLENVASISGGRVIELAQWPQNDFFVRPTTPPSRLQELWPYLLLSALIFLLFDVLVRRLAISWLEVRQAWQRRWRRWNAQPEPEVHVGSTLERLKSVKQTVGEQLRARRFEADASEAATTAAPTGAGSILDGGSTTLPTATKPPTPVKTEQTLTPQQEEQPADTFTSRLLQAKRKVWDERKEDK